MFAMTVCLFVGVSHISFQPVSYEWQAWLNVSSCEKYLVDKLSRSELCLGIANTGDSRTIAFVMSVKYVYACRFEAD
jgi:hypothetical protein